MKTVKIQVGWEAAHPVQDRRLPGVATHSRLWRATRVPGNGLAEGAVKELKAKIRTLRHSTEDANPETPDSLAWLVTHAAATINWFRPGLDGKTPYELRVGAQVSQTSGSMETEGLVDECEEARESHQR